MEVLAFAYNPDQPRDPVGTPTGGQWVGQQTNTLEFKRWFGDSKVVDTQGRPLRMYHGTAADFSGFKPRGEARPDIWFTTDVDMAGAFAGDVSGARIIPVYVSIKNPAPFGVSLGWAKDHGYDGVIVRNKDGIHTAVVFNPAQVKSAIGNRGTFDPKNEDILFVQQRECTVPAAFRPHGADIIPILAHADAHGRVYEHEDDRPRCFAHEGYYAEVKRTLDAQEERALKRLRGVLVQARDALISHVTRSKVLPAPRGFRLKGMRDFRIAVRDLLERASARGGADARREVREGRRAVKRYGSLGQPRDLAGTPTGGQWTSGGLTVEEKQELGTYLDTGGPNPGPAHTAAFMRGIEKLPRFNGEAFRGIRLENFSELEGAKLKVGTIFTWKGFSSFSKDLSVAEGFTSLDSSTATGMGTPNDWQIIFRAKLRGASDLASVAKGTKWAYQKEVLSVKKQKFVVRDFSISAVNRKATFVIEAL